MDYRSTQLFTNSPLIKISKKVDKWFGACRHGNFYEPELIGNFYRKLLERKAQNENNSIFFLDIGTNTGSFCFLTAIDDNLTCFCYEPNKEVYDILLESVSLNDLNDRVRCFNLGLWAENTQKVLKIPTDIVDSGLSTLGDYPTRFIYDGKDGEYKTVVLDCQSLDNHLMSLGVENKVDAIKIDTEGAEFFILKGAPQILSNHKPLLLLEYHNPNTQQFGYDREEIKDYLFDIGYNHFTIVGTGGDLMAEFIEDLDDENL